MVTEMAVPVRYHDGVPVYRYRAGPWAAPVSVARFGAGRYPGAAQRHIHDFPVLTYIEQAGSPRSPGPSPIRDGEVYVLAAGAVIDPSMVDTVAAGCGVFFDPTALGGDDRAPWSSWRSHPLLFPFLHGTPGGLLRLRVPPARRLVWSASIAAIEAELACRDAGYEQAMLAHLTLLLVDIARLADDVVDDLRRGNETLLAAVFDVIEQRLGEPLSLRQVADAVGMTPGHLTTLVRRRTGRTVVDWITERRMVRARTLLTHTDLPIGDVARQVGLPDAGYFARLFRRGNDMTPRQWRTATRQPDP